MRVSILFLIVGIFGQNRGPVPNPEFSTAVAEPQTEVTELAPTSNETRPEENDAEITVTEADISIEEIENEENNDETDKDETSDSLLINPFSVMVLSTLLFIL